MSALVSNRDVTITIGAEAMSPNAFIAVGNFVKEYEADYARNSSTPDIGVPATTTATKVVLPNVTPYSIFVFDVYADISAGTYNFDFIEEVPEHSQIS